MKLSIIVPVYNMAADGKLKYSLDSLISQTIRDKNISYEILLMDDASTDNSLEIEREYEKKFPDIVKVTALPVNGKQGTAKNKGLDIACGEWVSFIDCDDWVTPDYYEKMLDKAEETGADMVGCKLSMVSEHTMIPGEINEISQEEIIATTGIASNNTHRNQILSFGYMVLKIYKKSVIDDNNLRFPEGILYEDNCASVVWPMYFKHYEFIDEPMYFYYQHSASTVHTITEARCMDRMKAMEIMRHEMKDRGLLELFSPEIEFRFTELYFVNTLFSYMLGADKKELRFVRKLKKGMCEAFPNFRNNKYYEERIKDAEEKKMINLLMKNSLAFYIYYRLLWWYRRRKS